MVLVIRSRVAAIQNRGVVWRGDEDQMHWKLAGNKLKQVRN
jgi:hypothetical protein